MWNVPTFPPCRVITFYAFFPIEGVDTTAGTPDHYVPAVEFTARVKFAWVDGVNVQGIRHTGHFSDESFARVCGKLCEDELVHGFATELLLVIFPSWDSEAVLQLVYIILMGDLTDERLNALSSEQRDQMVHYFQRVIKLHVDGSFVLDESMISLNMTCHQQAANIVTSNIGSAKTTQIDLLRRGGFSGGMWEGLPSASRRLPDCGWLLVARFQQGSHS